MHRLMVTIVLSAVLATFLSTVSVVPSSASTLTASGSGASGASASPAGPSPALICDQPLGQLRDGLRQADLVVTGSIVQRGRDPQNPERFVLYTVRVERIYSGRAGREIEVRTPIAPSACGVPRMIPGESYVISADQNAGRLVALQTGGSGPFEGARRQIIVRTFGDGRAPVDNSPATPSTPKVTRTAVEGDAAPSFAAVAWPGVALVGGGLLVFLLALLFGRRPTS